MKLDLTNYRGEKAKRTMYIYESSSNADLMSERSSSSSTATGTGSFLIPVKVVKTTTPAQYPLDPIITNKGDFWEIEKILKYKNSPVKMSRATASDRVVDERLRIDTPCMNRVMSRSYNIAGVNNLYERVIAGKVPGGRISSTGLQDENFEALGLEKWRSVDYDALRWERSKYGFVPKGVKFTSAGLDMPEDRHSMSPPSSRPPFSPVPLADYDSGKGKIAPGKFSTQRRDAGPGIVRQEQYVKTGGMKLGPYYDWGQSQASVSSGVGGSWFKRAASLGGSAPARPDTYIPVTSNVLIKDIDCPILPRMSSSFKYSPLKYRYDTILHYNIRYISVF